jgi:NhaP-type Na+/H+ or K+/H+ antiporter
MIVGFAVADYYFDGTVKALNFLIEAIYFLIVGLIVGYVAWWIHEGRYQNARIEARINSNPKE